MKPNRLHLPLLLLTILIHTGCTMVNVTISEKRNPVPQHVTVGEQTTLTTWGAIQVNKSHFFPSSFQLKTEDQTIYIDPVGIDSAEPADLILITHAHPDHLSLPDIEKLLKEETQIICSRGVSKKLKHLTNPIHIVKPGDQWSFAGLTVEATFAYNTKSVFLWIKAHPKSRENVGYILTLTDGTRIYHAGDTDYIPEMKGIHDIQVVLVPIGGDNLTMNEEEAARIINEIKPDRVVPMHYELKNRKELDRFEELVDAGIHVTRLE